MQTEIEYLFTMSGQLNYDDYCGMVKVKKMMGPGFFPGCYGIHNLESGLNNKLVMVLGQDFDTEANHKKLTENGEVDSNPTWRNLKKLLEEIHINKDICFFTNSYMGLRKEGVRNMGKSPATKSPEFVVKCGEFFKKQLDVIKPEIVLVLGVEPAKFLAKVFPKFVDWKQIETLKSIYKEKKNTYYDLNLDNKDIRFLLTIHPSMSNSNRTLIFGKENRGEEVKMLKENLSEFYERYGIQNV